MTRTPGALLPALIAAAIVCSSGSASALDPSKGIHQYIHHHWGDAAGLPVNSVRALTQTRDGYLWIGTGEGLVRFDGARFTVFDKRNTPEFSSHFVNALYEDRAGVLWIGTLTGGLLRYQHGGFERVAGLEGDQVYAIEEAPDGAIWVGTERGLNRLQGAERRSYGVDQGLSTAFVLSIAIARDGVVWIGTNGGGLGRLQGDRVLMYGAAQGIADLRVFALDVQPDDQLLVGHSRGASRFDGTDFAPVSDVKAPVCAFSRDRNENLWLGTQGGGAVRVREGQPSVRFGPDEGVLGDMCALLEDHEGNLFLGSVGGGLHELSDSRVTTYSTREGLGDAIVLTTLEDRDGNVWLGTNAGGLSRLSGQKVTTFTTEHGLAMNSVRSLAETRDGRLWVGTGSGLHYRQGDEFVLFEPVGDLAISALLVDSQDDLWIGTVEQGLQRLSQGKLSSYAGSLGKGKKIWAIAEGSDGVVWVSAGGALLRLSGPDITPYGHEQGLTGKHILSLYEDERGDLWVGTLSDGLFRLRGDEAVQVTTEHGLLDDAVLSILEVDDALWMSSNRGIARLDKAVFDRFATGSSDSITIDRVGRKDGMKSHECNGGRQPAGWKARDGRLWFPTVAGAVMLDPRAFRERRPAPVVHLEGATVDGKSRPVGALLVLPAGTKRVQLDYTGISFRAPDLVAFRYRLDGFDDEWIEAGTRRSATYTNLRPGHYRFRVTASNADGVWNELPVDLAIEVERYFYQTAWFMAAGGLGIILLLMLIYRLRVRGLKLREQRLEQEVAERTKSLREAQEDVLRAERMASVATLVRGIAHELNNPISFIAANVVPLRRYCDFLSTAAQALGSGVELSEQERQSLTQLSPAKDLSFVTHDLESLMNDVEEGARRARLIVGDLQELTAGPRRSMEEVDLAQAIRQTLALLSYKLETITVTTEITEELPAISARAGQLEQVLVNLVDNAIQACAESGAIHIALERDCEYARLRVRDDGEGMSEEVLERALEPFFTTRAAGHGSGLGLAIVASIISAHGAEIEIESELGAGTEVLVRLPLEAPTS